MHLGIMLLIVGATGLAFPKENSVRVVPTDILSAVAPIPPDPGKEIPLTRTIVASTIAPGYDPANATACFVQAIKSAQKGDTVIIDYVKGTNGIWFLEGRHPHWFDGKNGEDRVAQDLTLIFEEGVTLKAIDSTYDHPSGLDMLFRLENVSGWKILGYGAKFEMDRAALPNGEYRNAMALYDCNNIIVEGLTVDGSGGDGIYIGTRTPTGFSDRITLNNMHFTNHRRQGMSILSGRNILVENVKFSGTLGRKPMSGLDLEGGPKHRFENITFKNVALANNGYSGILLALSKMNHTTTPLDIMFDGVYIFNNWQESGTLDPAYKKAAVVLGLGGGSKTAVTGAVTFNNILIKNEKFDGIFTLKHHDSYQLAFKDLVIENVGTATAPQAQYAIHTSRYNYGSPLPAVGNITFNGLLIRDDRNVPFWQLEGDSNDGWGIDNVVLANALIVSPYPKAARINNTTKAVEGPGTEIQYQHAPTLPGTVLQITANDPIIPRGSTGSFTVSRTGQDLAYPLAVEYSLSGTADNMDDFDFLHGYAIIPAGQSSVEIPISTRAKEDRDETLTLTLKPTPTYSLGKTRSGTLRIVSK